MEELISKLTEINTSLNGIIAFLGIYTIVSIFAFLILFFWYYDVCKKEDRKRLKKQIEREIREENNKNV